MLKRFFEQVDVAGVIFDQQNTSWPQFSTSLSRSMAMIKFMIAYLIANGNAESQIHDVTQDAPTSESLDG